MMLTIIAILFLIYIHQQSKKARYDRLMKEREEQRQIAMMNIIASRYVQQHHTDIEDAIQMKGLALYIEEQDVKE